MEEYYRLLNEIKASVARRKRRDELRKQMRELNDMMGSMAYEWLKPSTVTPELRHAMNNVRIRDNNTCRWYGCNSNKNVHVHHIFPQSEYPELATIERYMICYCAYHHKVFHDVRGDSAANIITVNDVVVTRYTKQILYYDLPYNNEILHLRLNITLDSYRHKAHIDNIKHIAYTHVDTHMHV